MERINKCEHSEQTTGLMSLGLDGLLDGSEHQRLEQHMAKCTACQMEWQSMQQISALFEGSPMIGPPLGFAVRIERKLAEREKEQRRAFGGVTLLTSSISLAGMTIATVVILILGILAWNRFGLSPAVLEGTEAASQIASGMGLMGKGASLFLGDLLLQYGLPVALLLGVGLLILLGAWTWLFRKHPSNTHHNGYA
jgi:anti-sigma factor RsiW